MSAARSSSRNSSVGADRRSRRASHPPTGSRSLSDEDPYRAAALAAKRAKDVVGDAFEYYTHIIRPFSHLYAFCLVCTIYIAFFIVDAAGAGTNNASMSMGDNRSTFEYILLHLAWHVIVIAASADCSFARSVNSKVGSALGTCCLWLLCACQLCYLDSSAYNQYKLFSYRLDAFIDHRNRVLAHSIGDQMNAPLAGAHFGDGEALAQLSAAEAKVIESKLRTNSEEMFYLCACLFALTVFAAINFYLKLRLYLLLSDAEEERQKRSALERRLKLNKRSKLVQT